MKLKNNENIAIKIADKRGAVAIKKKRQYQQMIYGHLNDSTTYRKLDKDTDKDVLKFLAQHFNKHINCFMEDESHRKFYSLPKIHKSLLIKEATEKQNTETITSL